MPTTSSSLLRRIPRAGSENRPAELGGVERTSITVNKKLSAISRQLW